MLICFLFSDINYFEKFYKSLTELNASFEKELKQVEKLLLSLYKFWLIYVHVHTNDT